MEQPAYEGRAVLEIMGHRRLAGYLSEQLVAGVPFVRIDVPGPEGTMASQLYSPSSVYAITPTTEEIARGVAAQNQPRPVHPWELPRLQGREPGNMLPLRRGDGLPQNLDDDVPL